MGNQTPLAYPKRRSYISRPYGQVAQLVEQRTENPRVGGSIPSLAIELSSLLFSPLYLNCTLPIVARAPRAPVSCHWRPARSDGITRRSGGRHGGSPSL